MNILMIHCDFQPESSAWDKVSEVLNNYEGKRHRKDSWFIVTEEPVSILYQSIKKFIHEDDKVLIMEVTTNYVSNFPKNITNWIDSKLI